MAFMDKTRCRAVAALARPLAPFTFAQHDKWGKQHVVVFKFLPGIDAVLIPVHGEWMLGGATTSGEPISDWLPTAIGVTTGDGGAAVATVAASLLKARYQAIAADESKSDDLRARATAGYESTL
jgi:hypothetical protein